jgi:hypothetical protein
MTVLYISFYTTCSSRRLTNLEFQEFLGYREFQRHLGILEYQEYQKYQGYLLRTSHDSLELQMPLSIRKFFT